MRRKTTLISIEKRPFSLISEELQHKLRNILHLLLLLLLEKLNIVKQVNTTSISVMKNF